MKLEKNKIHLCDVVEGLKTIPDSSVDIVLIDPPYNIGKDFGNSKYALEINEYVEWASQWMQESERILKDSGTMFIYGFSEILAHLSVKVTIPHRWLIWHYTNRNSPSKFWQRSHESIIVAWKKKDSRIFNLDDVREPYTETYKKGYSSGKVVRPPTKGRFQHKTDKGTETLYKPHANGALPRDVLKVAALAGGAAMPERWSYCKTCEKLILPHLYSAHDVWSKLAECEHQIIKHPTQKPQQVTRKLFASCKPSTNGYVVVPFAGSGSECAVAKEMNMDFIGFELNKDYVQLANAWVKEIKK